MKELAQEKFVVYCVARTVRHEMISFDSQDEATEFCEAYGWEWVDENSFVWDLEIDGPF